MTIRIRLIWLLVACTSLAAPGSAQNERVLKIPLEDGRLSMLTLSRTILNEYGFAGEHLNLRDAHINLESLPGMLMLKGLSKALQDSASFETDDRGNLVVRIDRLRARTMQNKARRRMATALGILAGGDVLQRHYEMKLPAGLGQAETWVLCIHGVESSPAMFTDFRAFVQQQPEPIKTGTYGYANDEAIDRVSRDLSQRLRAQKRAFPRRQILLVAHSMGGLVARHMLENPDLDPGNVTTLVMLGTPNQGSKLSRLRSGLDLLNFFDAHSNNARILAPMLDGLGEAGSDMVPGSPFLTALNARPRNPKVKYHLILGDRGYLSQEQLDALRQRSLKHIRRFRRHEIYEKKADGWFEGLDEVVHDKGDGAVSITRGRLSGVRHIVVPLNHTGLLQRSEPGTEQPAFDRAWKWLSAARRR